jgi:sec-independent protein translocase protein TatA
MVATLLQIGLPGTQEMMIILLIAVLLFGANKIPKLARSTGQAMGEFQKGREEVEQELEDIKEGPASGDGATEEPESEFVETAGDETASETSTS